MWSTLRETLGLLNKPIRLERSSGRVRVVLDPATVGAQHGSAEQALQRMRDELTNLLDRHRASRRSLRHLAYLERELNTKGAAAFAAIPEPVLTRASEQLEAVLTEPVSDGLAQLRSRIVVAKTAAEKIDAAQQKNAGPSSFLTEHKLQVSEASVSDFMRVMEQSQEKK